MRIEKFNPFPRREEYHEFGNRWRLEEGISIHIVAITFMNCVSRKRPIYRPFKVNFLFVKDGRKDVCYNVILFNNILILTVRLSTVLTVSTSCRVGQRA